MAFPNTNDELPDLSKLHLHHKTAPALLDSSSYNDLTSERLIHNDSTNSSSSSNNSQSSAGYHGLPNISADLQARVLAFQEKRQQLASGFKKDDHQLTHEQQQQQQPQQPQQQQQQPDTQQKKPEIRKNTSAPQQKSPEKKNDLSSSKKITPPLRLPPSLPQPNGPTSISSPLLARASPQALARLPRSRPSLSQRRGMKLNVNELTNDGDDNQTEKAATNRGIASTASKMITSSLSQSSSESLDTKKKPVAEFIGKRGQLPSSQQLPKLQGLFANYSKYVDIKSGSLNFNGKASLHSKGVDFSGGSSFRISIDELEFIEELGRGNYGTVSKVLHKPTNIIMAMKEVRLELDDSKFRQIIMELEILHNCDSRYIVDFYGAFFVEGAVYMCIEFMNLGSLDKIYKGGLPEPQLAFIAKCVIKGLKQLKDEQNIIHRDVKPTNILVNDQGKIKLCDFGVSGNLVLSMARTNIGCQSYMAPERIKSANPDDTSYSVQSDIWSLGLSLLEVASGEYPLVSENIFSQLKQIVEDDPPTLSEKFSNEAKDFVACCLAKDPQLRPTYLELLQHPWIVQYDDDVKSELDLKEYLSHIQKI